MKVFVIFSCSLDGDSWLVYSCKAVCADVAAAVRWIDANPLLVPNAPTVPPVAHPLMNKGNHWTVFCTRAEVDLLDQQSKVPEFAFGYVVEEMEVVA